MSKRTIDESKDSKIRGLAELVRELNGRAKVIMALTHEVDGNVPMVRKRVIRPHRQRIQRELFAILEGCASAMKENEYCMLMQVRGLMHAQAKDLRR